MDQRVVRADAAHNAERLVEAARVALAETGLGITTRELAQRAGVGLGTVHRRIPSLSGLLEALLTEAIEGVTELARRAGASGDVWDGFRMFAETYVQVRAASCGLHEALSGRGANLNLSAPLEELALAIRALVEDGQRHGVIRRDIEWQDVPFLLASAIPDERTIGLTAKHDQWHRNLRVILDGLRPSCR